MTSFPGQLAQHLWYQESETVRVGCQVTFRSDIPSSISEIDGGTCLQPMSQARATTGYVVLGATWITLTNNLNGGSSCLVQVFC